MYFSEFFSFILKYFFIIFKFFCLKLIIYYYLTNKNNYSNKNKNVHTISGTRGSLGFGQFIKLHIATKTPSNVIKGFQAPVGGIFKIFKQILPPLSMFGW